jgi:hypothetical protein
MNKNSTYLFVFDNINNEEELYLPLKLQEEFNDVFASLPLYPPPKKSVERLLKLIENEV